MSTPQTAQRAYGADQTEAASGRALVYRQFLSTRLTHWLWAICLFFLLLSGLQIFNAHPELYIGHQSGFGFDNAALRIGAQNTQDGPIGYTEILGTRFDTTQVLGLFGTSSLDRQVRAFPSWITIPSYQDLATGRVVHLFFAWVLVATLAVWLCASVINGHVQRDLLPRRADARKLPRDVWNHLRLKFHHVREYNTLQKLSYGAVLFIMLPLMILTGLAMSPGVDHAVPYFPDILGGRQTARTIHFVVMLLLVVFFFVHILMVLAAGPVNELRSIVTGWYRTDPPAPDHDREDA